MLGLSLKANYLYGTIVRNWVSRAGFLLERGKSFALCCLFGNELGYSLL